MSVVPFPKAVKQFPKVRQSRLSKFDDCALSSKFDEDFGRGWSSHPAARGTITHRTLARCLRIMVENDESTIPIDVALAELEDVIRQADVEVEGSEVGEIVSVPLRALADSRVTVMTWAMHTAWPVRNIAGIEKRLETTLTYPDGKHGKVERIVSGQVDLLLITPDGETAEVWDWKDTWGVPPEKSESGNSFGGNVSDEGYFQQRFYSLLTLRNLPRIKRVKLVEFYPRYAGGTTVMHGKTINPKREAVVTREALSDIEAEMSGLLERFDRAHDSGKFRAAPGTHCSYCLRPRLCPIDPEARGVGRIYSKFEAERAADTLVTARAVATQATGALRAWSNAHGDVRVRSAKKPMVYGPVVRQEVNGKTGEVKEKVTFTVHSPEEQHPLVSAARAEEDRLVQMERAAAARRRRKAKEAKNVG